MRKLKIEFSKFTLVGAVNFIFTFILFFWSVKVMQWNYLLSLIWVSLAGMILTYSLNFIWVFKPERSLAFGWRLMKYVLANSLSIALNAAILKYIVDQTGFDPFYIQMALIPAIVFFNFSTAKYWSLRSSISGRKEGVHR